MQRSQSQVPFFHDVVAAEEPPHLWKGKMDGKREVWKGYYGYHVPFDVPFDASTIHRPEAGSAAGRS